MIRQVIFTFGTRLASAVFNFLVIIVLSRELGPEGKGLCTRYLTIIANTLIFCDLVGGPAIVFISARYKARNILLPSYAWSLFSSAITIGIFSVLSRFNSNDYFVMVLLAFLNSAFAIHQNILLGRMKFTQLNLLILFQAALTFFSLLFFIGNANPTEGLNAYVNALSVAWLLSALGGFVAIMLIRDAHSPIAFSTFFPKAFRYGFTNAAGHGLQFFNQRLSYFLLSEKMLGFFSNAVSVGESMWMVSNSIASVQYGKISNTTDPKLASLTSLAFLKLNLVLCFFASIILVCLPDSLYVFLFGEEFAGIHAIMIILAPGLFFYSGFLVLGHHFSGMGLFAKNLYPTLVGLLVTACGLIVYYFGFGGLTIERVSIISSASYISNFIVVWMIFRKDHNFSIRDFIPGKRDLDLIRGREHKTIAG